MADLENNVDANGAGEPVSEGATIGTETIVEGSPLPATPQEAEATADTDATEDVAEDIDFETAFANLEAEKPEEGEADDRPAPADMSADDRLTEYHKTLRSLQSTLESMPESEQDSSVTKMLRKLNRELVSKHEAEVSGYAKLANYGDIADVEKALEFYEGLKGYDISTGAPSAAKAADMLATQSPETAYNLALNVMKYQDSKGVPFAEQFTRQVLGLDPSRLADFQAISRGETPVGYEGAVLDQADLSDVPKGYEDAFKRLTPKMRELVSEGLVNYASVADKSEAMRILQESHRALTNEAQEQADAVKKNDAYRAKLVETATAKENESTTAIGSKINGVLDMVTFSSDSSVDLTMKQALSMQLFNLTNEQAYIRESAEKYFKEMGIDVQADRKNIDYWYNRLSENIDIETVAELRDQKTSVEEARRVRAEAERRLAVMARGYVAKIAKKTGAGLKARGEKQVPQNQLPPPDRGAPPASGERKYLDYRDVQKANAAGQSLAK